MKHSIISDCLSAIDNAEEVGKDECVVPASDLMLDVLKVMQREGYIGEFELLEDNKGGKFRVKLVGEINKCKVVRPHFSAEKDEFEKWEKRYLPAKGLGVLIVSTSRGIMTHRDAKEKGVSGKLMAYVY